MALATILGPLLAAGIAAYAALTVLPKQRKIQQDIDWHRDKRKQFAIFLSALNDVLSHDITKLTNESKEVIALNGAHGIIEITSTNERTREAAKNIMAEVNKAIIDNRPRPRSMMTALTALNRENFKALSDLQYTLMGLDPTQARLSLHRKTLLNMMREELEELETP